MLGATFLFYMPRYTHLILLILEILVMKMSNVAPPPSPFKNLLSTDIGAG